MERSDRAAARAGLLRHQRRGSLCRHARARNRKDRSAARLAGELRQEWARKGKTFLLADMIIAAVCLTGGLTLVTDNRKDFAMPGLTLHPLP
jgi:predicted nucleic acid-binding protein